MSNNEFLYIAVQMCQKAWHRRGPAVDAQNLDSEGSVHLYKLQESAPQITSCEVVQRDNFTVVTLNGNITTFAKFNPNDTYTRQVKRKGKTKPEVQVISKFSIEAGASRAIHRAVSKLLMQSNN